MRSCVWLILVFIVATGCTSTNLAEHKEKLKSCYEKQCELVFPEYNLSLEYPLEFCYYESRENCIDEASTYLSVNFCNNFTYKKLCYEDLAVVKRDKALCSEANKPTKDDALFKEFKKQYSNESEDVLFKAYAEFLAQTFNVYCETYYDAAIRVIESNISHCEQKKYSEANYCYSQLISKFNSITECDRFRDLLKSNYADKCYWWYASLHNDSNSCYQLNDSNLQKECLSEYTPVDETIKFCMDGYAMKSC